MKDVKMKLEYLEDLKKRFTWGTVITIVVYLVNMVDDIVRTPDPRSGIIKIGVAISLLLCAFGIFGTKSTIAVLKRAEKENIQFEEVDEGN